MTEDYSENPTENMFQPKVNEEFTVNGTHYRCKLDDAINSCDQCAFGRFGDDNSDVCPTMNCIGEYREDGNSVHFVEVKEALS